MHTTTTPYADNATLYAALGWAPLPLPAGEKFPPPSGFTGAEGAWPSDDELALWTEQHGNGNIAIRFPRNVIGLDVDDYGNKAGGASLEALVAQYGELPDTIMGTSREDGVSGIRLYGAPEGLVWPSQAGPDIEVIRFGHRYAVAAPSLHPDGRTYRWISTATLEETPDFPSVDELPELPAAWVAGLTANREKARAVTADDVAEWVARLLEDGDAGAEVDEILSRFSRELECGERRHDAMLDATAALVLAAIGGAEGARAGIETAEGMYVAAKGENRETQADWARGLKGALEWAGFAAPAPALRFEVDGYSFEPRPKGAAGYDRHSIADSHLGARVGLTYLRGRFIAWGTSAWSQWDGRRWARTSPTAVFEAVRKALLEIHAEESAAAKRRHDVKSKEVREGDYETDDARRAAQSAEDKALSARLKALEVLLYARKINDVLRVARGLLEVKQEVFDSHTDLLNVGNGVVDLRTGELRPHDPGLFFTKVTEVDYRPGASHADWEAALTALPGDVAEWMQVRFGQAATGYATSDDMVPFLHGGGANGKSTILAGVRGGLGDFAVMVPDKVLLASPSDHPTELMTLRGARLAFIEELPEGDYLNAQRLKKAAGTDGMSARYIGQDNVSWTATHSLMVTTNYDVHVDAVDWGTWRRLALVTFPYTFDGTDPDRPKDEGLRARILHGEEQHEAALAWIVEGARRWYAAGQTIPKMPEAVARSTSAWRHSSNHAARFIDEMLELDESSAVRSSDVFAVFSAWAAEAGIRKWNDRTFWTRAKQHEWFAEGLVEKADGSVRTSGWSPGYGEIRSVTFKKHERLVTGIRLSPEAVKRLPIL